MDNKNYVLVDRNTMEALLRALHSTTQVLDKMVNEATLAPETSEEPTKIESSSEESIMVTATNYLKKLGIPANIKGYHYLRTAIIMVDEDNSLKEGITKALYPAIAKQHRTTPSRVERAIRHAIEVGYDNGDLSEYEKLFGYSISANKGKATNSHFIASIVDDIHLRRLTK